MLIPCLALTQNDSEKEDYLGENTMYMREEINM